MVSKPCGKQKNGTCPYKFGTRGRSAPSTNGVLIRARPSVKMTPLYSAPVTDVCAAMFNEEDPVITYEVVDSDNKSLVNDTSHNSFYSYNSTLTLFMQQVLE